MSARSVSNGATLARTLRRLRSDGRLDDVGELLAVLATTSARQVDEACASDSAAPAYARAACLRVHVAVLSELAGRVAPAPTDASDPWERIAAALEPDVPDDAAIDMEA
jgi:hypothetical protein